MVDPVGADRHDQGGGVGQHAELGELELAVGGQREDGQRAQPEQPEHGSRYSVTFGRATTTRSPGVIPPAANRAAAARTRSPSSA